mmetsp:Transcript_19180/g.25288  ORF Transcript_19180/g.25288 Transcript_19180/m.25288 type:complete len:217 (+) Transcript_19180:119-769(+)
MTTSLPKLTYFPAAGRTWGLRIALHSAYGKDGWIDERIQFKDWAAMKPTTPLGSLPILELPSGKVMTQCDALTRWAGKQGGLYPEDAAEALVVDETTATSFEALNQTPGRGLSLEEKKTAREEYAQGFLSTALKLLEKRVTETSGPFLTGDKLTIGDLSIVMLTDMIISGDFDFVSPSLVIDGFSELAAHREAVLNHDLVKDYYSTYDTKSVYHKG